MKPDAGFLHYPFAACACCPADPNARVVDPLLGRVNPPLRAELKRNGIDADKAGVFDSEEKAHAVKQGTFRVFIDQSRPDQVALDRLRAGIATEADRAFLSVLGIALEGPGHD